ncbi:hypothetical protein RHMOL_Rhmol08G0176300 [Rhododendron molle]|uniref:Uncharacterized protein n=1 Tax=Rhododendron molle TaxID=49168 RepID=A0ACC0MPT2_RHOML|nr:hypothetical protein RHMOL_Rhmol08G0176300 [Rhododendron molle]
MFTRHEKTRNGIQKVKRKWNVKRLIIVCEHENPIESERMVSRIMAQVCMCEHENAMKSERWLAEPWLRCACEPGAQWNLKDG